MFILQSSPSSFNLFRHKVSFRLDTVCCRIYSSKSVFSQRKKKFYLCHTQYHQIQLVWLDLNSSKVINYLNNTYIVSLSKFLKISPDCSWSFWEPIGWRRIRRRRRKNHVCRHLWRRRRQTFQRKGRRPLTIERRSLKIDKFLIHTEINFINFRFAN